MSKNKGKFCYWCGATASTTEHVPPKCLFPEDKDVTDDSNYRKNLITVPSCIDHNIAKSQDDEYLLIILAISILSNPVGFNQAKTKVMRALERSNKLQSSIFSNTIPIKVKEIGTENLKNTFAKPIDNQRIDNVFEHISRAIYFHHFSERWAGTVKFFTEFTMSLNLSDLDESRIVNEKLEELRSQARELFMDLPRHGENQGVFYYQISQQIPHKSTIIRLAFYEGSYVTVVMEC